MHCLRTNCLNDTGHYWFCLRPVFPPGVPHHMQRGTGVISQLKIVGSRFVCFESCIFQSK